MIKIISDSTCDLSKDLLDKYDIEVIPLSVNFSDGVSYNDGVDITTEELYKLVEEKNELPKTAAIPEIILEETFQKYVDLGYDVIFTGISAQMSRTYENACLAREAVSTSKIFVVDSMNLSTGIGLLLLKACKYRDEGDKAQEIALKMENDRHRILSQFVIETMDYLHKGGRCSSLAKFFGTLLKIKPIINVREGKMAVAQKPIGKVERGLDIMINQIIKDKDNLDTDHIFVTHSIALKSRDYIMAKLKEVFKEVDIIETVAGCVISSHCGKGTIGILYMLKK